MLYSTNDLQHLTIRATDGDLGSVRTFYFDNAVWIVRYLVVDTGHWLPGRRVLIAPESIGVCDPSQGVLSVDLTQEQVKNSPDVDTDKPVSKQQEISLRQHYNWPAYWTMQDPLVAQDLLGRPSSVPIIPPSATELVEIEPGDPHLHSMREVTGYHIQATDGSIGHVEDFIVDSETWHIRYLVVDTRNWLPGGKKVLIAPPWIDAVSWEDARVNVGLSQNEIKMSPEWHGSSEALSRAYETALYRHYSQPTYWRS